MKAIKSSLQKPIGCYTSAQSSNQDTLSWSNNTVLESGKRISDSSSTAKVQLPFHWGETSSVHIVKIKNCSSWRRNIAEVHTKHGTTSRIKRRLFLPLSSQWEKKEMWNRTEMWPCQNWEEMAFNSWLAKQPMHFLQRGKWQLDHTLNEIFKNYTFINTSR